MRTKTLILLMAIATPLYGQGAIGSAGRAELNLNGNWQYMLNQPQSPIPVTGWATERVPALPVQDGTASIWYKNTFYVPSAWVVPGRRFFIKIDKAGHYAAVYSNGQFAGEHFGQYSPFEFEVTSSIVANATNEIEIYTHKADTVYVRSGVNIDQSGCPSSNPDCIGNAYRPAANDDQSRNWVGLAGDITFSWRPSQYISDTYVTTSVRNWTLTAQVSVSGAGTFAVQGTVYDGSTAVLSLPLTPVEGGQATMQGSWSNPVLWGPPPYGQPKLYTLQTKLRQKSGVVDTTYTQFGFREVWVEGRQVLLNGQPLWMSGDYFYKLTPLTYVNDRRPQAFALYIMEMSGMNTLQSHWDDPGESWLQLADEMGVLMVGSFFCDGRPVIQSQVDDVDAWTNWMASTATEWTVARRNHPSIVLWRPTDVLPTQISQSSAWPVIDGAVRAADSLVSKTSF